MNIIMFIRDNLMCVPSKKKHPSLTDMKESFKAPDALITFHSLAMVDSPKYGIVNLKFQNLVHLQLPWLQWYNADSVPTSLNISFESETVVISGKWAKHPVFIAGGPLQDVYKFNQIHYHWGNTDEEGSHHLVDGKFYPLECHALFYKKLYKNFKNATKHNDGVVCICYLFQIEDVWNNELQPLTSSLIHLIKNTKSITVKDIPITHYISKFINDYLLYWGNSRIEERMYPVIYIISRKTIGISEHQINLFRQLWYINKGFRNTKKEPIEAPNRSLFIVNAPKAKKIVRLTPIKNYEMQFRQLPPQPSATSRKTVSLRKFRKSNIIKEPKEKKEKPLEVQLSPDNAILDLIKTVLVTQEPAPAPTKQPPPVVELENVQKPEKPKRYNPNVRNGNKQIRKKSPSVTTTRSTVSSEGKSIQAPIDLFRQIIAKNDPEDTPLPTLKSGILHDVIKQSNPRLIKSPHGKSSPQLPPASSPKYSRASGDSFDTNYQNLSSSQNSNSRRSKCSRVSRSKDTSSDLSDTDEPSEEIQKRTRKVHYAKTTSQIPASKPRPQANDSPPPPPAPAHIKSALKSSTSSSSVQKAPSLPSNRKPTVIRKKKPRTPPSGYRLSSRFNYWNKNRDNSDEKLFFKEDKDSIPFWPKKSPCVQPSVNLLDEVMGELGLEKFNRNENTSSKLMADNDFVISPINKIGSINGNSYLCDLNII